MRARRGASWQVALTLLGVSAILAACGASQDQTSEAPDPQSAEDQLATNVNAVDDGSAGILAGLLAGPEEEQAALNEIVAGGDERFAGVLVDLLRGHELGIVAGRRASVIEALETLSGEQFGNDWPAWVEWYGGTTFEPPPGFNGWKGGLLARIDERFGPFLTDASPTAIRTEEIVWGGVAVDGIPALDNPVMVTPVEATYLEPAEPVFGIELNGDARAYPLRIMDWHEMANDVVGGVPISLAYCTLCGAGIAYHGVASNGTTYDFGSSGLLYRSNKLMYDRQTRTLWNQFTGEPVVGELVDGEVTLERLPVVLTSWESWLGQHPETVVLDIETGWERPYKLGAAYGHYFRAEDAMFPVWQRRDDLPTKSRVYGLHIDGLPKAYPLDTLAEEKVLNDVVGKTEVVLVATRGVVTVWPEPVDYEAGGEVRAYERGDRTFKAGPDPDTVIDSAGEPWQVTEEALVGPDGELAPRLSGHLAYWFGWYEFFPRTLLYGDD